MNSSHHLASTDDDQVGVTGADRASGRIDESAIHAPKPTRLSVNISRDTVEALQEIAADKGITITEALRRLVGYGIIVYRANRDRYEVLLRRDGKLEKIILVD